MNNTLIIGKGKCCTQYASKFGKLSTGHRTGKGQFSFQSLRQEMPKNVQIMYNCTHFISQQDYAQNPSSLASVVHELRTSRCTSWIQKRQRNQRSTFAGSQEKQENSKKSIYFCFPDYAKSFNCVDHNKLWNILEEMGTPDYLNCLLRNLYAGQETTVRIVRGTMDWFKIGKGVCQGCILSPCLFNCMQSTSYEMQGWMKHKLETRLLGEISITSDMQMIPLKWQKMKRN